MHTARFLIAGIAALFTLAVSNSLSDAAQGAASVERRLQLLEDREEIRQLLLDYGLYLDKGDFASFANLFAAKEGEWIGGLGKAKGVEGIRKLMEDTIGRGAKDGANPSCHLFTNESIQVQGDRATALTKWVFVVQSASKQPQPVYVGHYEDKLVRERGKWKFLTRTVYGDIPPDDPLSPRK